MAPSTLLAARRPLLTSIASVTRPSRTTLRPITQSSRFYHCQQTRPSTPATKSTTPSIPRRKYHSTHQPTPDHEYTNSQTTILTAALRHVPELGFTRDALTLGARDAGFLDVSVQLLPRGEFDLILFWLASRRGLLRAAVDNGLFRHNGPRELSVEQKTKMLVMERLRMNADVRNQWQDALALMALPSNVPLSLSELHALSDDILALAGDTSVDASWYTKRLAVSAVYASAEVVLTRDPSPDLTATEAFVERRFEDTQALGDKVGGVKQCLGFMGSTALGLGRSWGLKI
ncbi:ubiquinone biosynthesis protein COQ9 [Aspergillus taichungensis]|uniref:Ubiquinone biosynthesis protein n=1 Tax=Aspergillus taichungensis TaxID=482145 RepID=A0A2J5I0D1_9EURO|nr:ubiquinone biosynthesis protein COQ9 [Aspergillus taichungensis]